MTDTQTREDVALAEIKEAMKGSYVSLHIVYAFGIGDGVQVKVKTRKIGPLLFPPRDGTLADVLTMLAEFRAEAAA